MAKKRMTPKARTLGRWENAVLRVLDNGLHIVSRINAHGMWSNLGDPASAPRQAWANAAKSLKESTNGK